MYVTKEDWNINLEPKLYLDGQIESITLLLQIGITHVRNDLGEERLNTASPYTPFSLILLFCLFTLILFYVFL